MVPLYLASANVYSYSALLRRSGVDAYPECNHHMKSVVEVYPSIDFMGNHFIKQLEGIAKREKGVREDLSLTGNAVLVELKKRSKSWIMVQAFGHITVVGLVDPKENSQLTSF